MAWARCGNLPYYRKTIRRNTFYVNPFNWSQVVVSQEKSGEWAGIGMLTYRKVERYDWDILKVAVEAFVPQENQGNVLRATHEWFSDRMKAQQTAIPNAKVVKLFNDAPDQTREYALDGVSAMIGSTASGDAITLVAVEEGSPAYKDISDIRQVFDYAEKFFIAPTLEQALNEALDSLGIYEC